MKNHSPIKSVKLLDYTIPYTPLKDSLISFWNDIPKSKLKPDFQIKESQSTPNPLPMKTAVAIVVCAHMLIVAGLMLTSSRAAKAKQIADDKRTLAESYTYTGVDDIKDSTKVNTQNIPVKYLFQGSTQYPQAKIHVVGKGDTFLGLVKKYNLDPKKFIQINQIKDINKITEGQKLVIRGR